MNLRNLAITSVIILGLLAAYAAVSQGGAMNGAVGGPGAAGRPRAAATAPVQHELGAARRLRDEAPAQARSF